MKPARFALMAGAAFAVLTSLHVLTLVWSDARPANTGAVSPDERAAIGGPFEMTDDRGSRVSEADLLGRPSAIFFGFTYCPDVCPTTLFEMAALMERLGEDAQRLNFVFVTVDPERDTPEILHEYLTAFDERIRGFTGTPEEVDRIAQAYRVHYERIETESGYTMDHNASVYLMDSTNAFVGTITYHEDQATALEKLRRLIARS